MYQQIILFSILSLWFVLPGYALNTCTDSASIKEFQDTLALESGSNQQTADTSYFTVGKKNVEIIEINDSTYVKIWEEGEEKEDLDDDEEGFDFDKKLFEKSSRFRGHWAGFEFGMNNYVDDNFSLNRSPESEFMDISTNNSWNFNLNFIQYSLPIHTSYFGAVTGMGIEWSNYHFSNSNTIVKNTQTQQIEEKTLTQDLIKNRFQTTYLTVPLLFEVQFFDGARKDRMYVSAGLIGGLKLGANTKVTYTENGNKRKENLRGDYYLRPFRYAFTGRLGYKLLKVYMNYYPVSLFLDERGPELYPVAMGFCLTF